MAYQLPWCSANFDPEIVCVCRRNDPCEPEQSRKPAEEACGGFAAIQLLLLCGVNALPRETRLRLRVQAGHHAHNRSHRLSSWRAPAVKSQAETRLDPFRNSPSTAYMTTSPSTSMALPRTLYSSMASRKRSSPTVKPLPESVAWLSDISLEMTSTNSIRASVKYNLRMVYQPKHADALSWDVPRSFDQYRAFQKRLLRQLRPKHSCKAECRWLYSTVKKHFPKPTLIGSHCPALVELRRKALLQILSTVQASILNHGNRGCKVMMEAVSNELASFLVADDTNGAEGVTPPVTPTASSELETEPETPASSLQSFTSSISSEEGEENLDTVNYDGDQWLGWSLPVAGPLNLARTTSSPV